MGAEGTIVVLKREVWDEKYPGVSPGSLGFYSGHILGVEAVWSYYGENTYYEMAPEMYANAEEKIMVEWFRANAEEHEVWT